MEVYINGTTAEDFEKFQQELQAVVDELNEQEEQREAQVKQLLEEVEGLAKPERGFGYYIQELRNNSTVSKPRPIQLPSTYG